MKKDKTLFSVLLSTEDQRKFEAVSKSREKKKAELLREWIRRSYSAMEVRK